MLESRDCKQETEIFLENTIWWIHTAIRIQYGWYAEKYNTMDTYSNMDTIRTLYREIQCNRYIQEYGYHMEKYKVQPHFLINSIILGGKCRNQLFNSTALDSSTERSMLGDTQNWQQNSSNLTSPLCKRVMTQKMTNSQWTADHLTTQECESKQIEFPTVTFVQTFSWSTGVLVFHHSIVKFPNDYYRMEKILNEEEKQRINALLEKYWPREETKEKEMVVLSEKGRKISIKTEAASSSMKPFEEQPVEHEEEASKRKYEVIGTNIETEYEEMDTEEEECEVRKLTKEELEMYHQYKEFYTIQRRTKGKIPRFWLYT